MGNIICHHEGKYNFYNTVSDSFYYDVGLTLEEFEEEYRKKYGEKGMRELPQRVERANKSGTSCRMDEDLEGTLICNRAGKDEEHLTLEECIRQFLT